MIHFCFFLFDLIGIFIIFLFNQFLLFILVRFINSLLNFRNAPHLLRDMLVMSMKNIWLFLSTVTVITLIVKRRVWSSSFQTVLDKFKRLVWLIFLLIFLKKSSFIVSLMVINLKFFVFNECPSDNNFVYPAWNTCLNNLIISYSLEKHIICLYSMDSMSFKVNFLLNNLSKILLYR